MLLCSTAHCASFGIAMSSPVSARALLPLGVFLSLFLGTGLWFTLQGHAEAFYQLRATVAILPAIALALWMGRRDKPLDTLLAGMGNADVMLMCLIFLLAGAFAAVSKAIGGVDAVVWITLSLVPSWLALPGLFLVAGFVALAMGTSMGTIAAVAPIALGVAQAAGLDPALALGAVLSGATFGDNLSVISDTAIAASRLQGATLRDKFRANFWLALPAAVACLPLLAALGGGGVAPQVPQASPWLALPYLVVLVLAVAGVDVLVVLSVGLLLASGFGLAFKAGYSATVFSNDIYAGFEGMFEITLLSLLIGGLAALVRAQGGLAWLAAHIARLAGGTGRRSGELSIAAVATVTDVFTANNTVALLISGNTAREIAQRHGVSPARSASLLDVFACVTQSVLPYGAQILLAASIAKASPLVLVGTVHYGWLLALCALASIALGWPRRAVARSLAAQAG
jgi:Na+/H+ antiporter NhaC